MEDNTASTQSLHFANLCHNSLDLFTKGNLCDLTLVTENQSVDCHRIILASCSIYFKRLLLNTNDCNVNIVDVSPVEFNVLSEIIAFMYRGRCNITRSNLYAVFDYSIKWKLRFLSQECFEFMRKNCMIQDVCMNYELAAKLKDRETISFLSQYIREHFTDIHKHGYYKQLSINNLCDLLDHDEINIPEEHLIFDAIVKHTQRQSPECFALPRYDVIRFEHINKKRLLEDVRRHPLMKDAPQRDYVTAAIKLGDAKDNMVNFAMRPERSWSNNKSFMYVNKNRMVSKYSTIKKGWVDTMMVPDWIDEDSTFLPHQNCLLSVGAQNSENGRNVAMTYAAGAEVNWPQLPYAVYNTGLLHAKGVFYVIGGRIYEEGKWLRSNRVFYRKVHDKGWSTLPELPVRVSSPLVILHGHYIYAIGGVNSEMQQESCVQEYSLPSGKWRCCRMIPKSCHRDDSGVVIFENKVTVFTGKCYVAYDRDKDLWSGKYYKAFSCHVMQPVILNDAVCACVLNAGEATVMTYNMDCNEWSPIVRNVPDIWWPYMFATI